MSEVGYSADETDDNEGKVGYNAGEVCYNAGEASIAQVI